MPVNLYDSPAQANFINTYVPIQFEGLYKVADQAQKNLDAANAMEDEAVTNYSSLNSPSSADRDTWSNQIYKPVSDYINNNITDSDSLKDPTIQSGLKSVIRRMKSSPLGANLVASAQNMKDFVKKSDPRWGAYESNKALGHNTSTDGVFDETNLPYQSIDEIVKPVTDGMHPGGTSLGTDRAGFEHTGWSEKQTSPMVQAATPDMLQSPITQAHLAIQQQQGLISPTATPTYYDKDPNTGALVLNKARALYGMVRPYVAKHEWDSKTLSEQKKLQMQEASHDRESQFAYDLNHPASTTPTLDAQEMAMMQKQKDDNLMNLSYQKIKANPLLATSGPGIKSNTFGQAGLDYTNTRSALENGTQQENVLYNQSVYAPWDKSIHDKYLDKKADNDKLKAILNDPSNTGVTAKFKLAVTANRMAGEGTERDNSGNLIPSAFSRDELRKASVVSNSPEYINRHLADRLGTPTKIKTPSNPTADAYDVKDGNRLSLLAPGTQQELAPTSKNPAAMRLATVLHNGELNGNSTYEPSNVSNHYSDKTNNIGTLRVPVDKFEEIMDNNKPSTSTSNADWYDPWTWGNARTEHTNNTDALLKSGIVKKEHVAGKILANGDEEGGEDYYTIPTSANLDSYAPQAAQETGTTIHKTGSSHSSGHSTRR